MKIHVRDFNYNLSRHSTFDETWTKIIDTLHEAPRTCVSGYQCLYGYHGHVVTNLTNVPTVIMVTFIIVGTKVVVVLGLRERHKTFSLCGMIYATCLMTHEL